MYVCVGRILDPSDRKPSEIDHRVEECRTARFQWIQMFQIQSLDRVVLSTISDTNTLPCPPPIMLEWLLNWI